MVLHPVADVPAGFELRRGGVLADGVAEGAVACSSEGVFGAGAGAGPAFGAAFGAGVLPIGAFGSSAGAGAGAGLLPPSASARALATRSSMIGPVPPPMAEMAMPATRWGLTAERSSESCTAWARACSQTSDDCSAHRVRRLTKPYSARPWPRMAPSLSTTTTFTADVPKSTPNTQSTPVIGVKLLYLPQNGAGENRAPFCSFRRANISLSRRVGPIANAVHG